MVSSRATSITSLGSFEVGTSEHFRWLYWIVKAVLVLNLFDAVFTLFWVELGVAVEANALLRDLVHEHALAFVLAKLSLVSLGALFLWRYRRHPLAVVAIFGAFLIYYLILLHHLRYSSLFLGQIIGY